MGVFLYAIQTARFAAKRLLSFVESFPMSPGFNSIYTCQGQSFSVETLVLPRSCFNRGILMLLVEVVKTSQHCSTSKLMLWSHKFHSKTF